jgi:hypothetical protein
MSGAIPDDSRPHTLGATRKSPSRGDDALTQAGDLALTGQHERAIARRSCRSVERALRPLNRGCAAAI